MDIYNFCEKIHFTQCVQFFMKLNRVSAIHCSFTLKSFMIELSL